jgi:S-adenosylmethionine hydrolase
MKTRIHVNQHNIKANAKEGAKLPVITAKTYKENKIGNNADIVDAYGNVIAKIIYSPDKPLSCGAKCWVETTLDVKVY